MFFLFKPKTAYEMRISDWSSDVCSSDLRVAQPALDQKLCGLQAVGHDQTPQDYPLLGNLAGWFQQMVNAVNPVRAGRQKRCRSAACRRSGRRRARAADAREDRKSTRLNSSH